jgi:hypothetical protein
LVELWGFWDFRGLRLDLLRDFGLRLRNLGLDLFLLLELLFEIF